MSGKRANTSGKKRPPQGDDFKLINGVTPALAARLREARISTFAQLAAISPANLAELLSDPARASEARIVEQDWIGQARELARSSRPQASAEERPTELASEGFVVDLFLDAAQTVRKTQVLQVSSGEGEEWEGWDEARLLDFFVRRAELRVATRHQEPAPVAEALQAEGMSEAAVPPEPLAPRTEAFKLCAVEAVTASEQQASHLLKRDAPFDVRLTLAADNAIACDVAHDYAVSISARRWQDGSRRVVAQHTGRLRASDEVLVINIAQPSLPPGAYQLEATLETKAADQPATQPAQLAAARSALLQVY